MFSVIIPLYNKLDYIKRAIDSVLGQNFREFEILVVNDGSTDGGEIFVKNNFGTSIILIDQPNKGVSVARNTGISNSKFPFVAFLDADDYWHRDYLRWVFEVLQKYPEIKLVGTSYSNKVLPEKIENPQIEFIKNYFSQADKNTLFTSSSTVMHKSFFEQNQGFNPHLIYGEDVDVWFRANAWFRKSIYIQAPLMFYDLKASSSIALDPMLNRTIFSEIYRSDYAISHQFPNWIGFRDKYLLLNLFQYFSSQSNMTYGKLLLSKKRNSFFLAEIPYFLPHSFHRFILSNPILKKWLRNYLKFCFHYIYT